MLTIIDKLLVFFGILVNFYPLLNIFFRPVLWSTTNSFIITLLASNIFFLNFQIIIEEADERYIPVETVISDAFEFGLSKTGICSARYGLQLIHGSLSLTLLLGLVFIRSILVKHANNIRTTKCHTHQARLSFIGGLVTILILTFNISLIITFILNPLPLGDYVLVRYCSGVSCQNPNLTTTQGWV